MKALIIGSGGIVGQEMQRIKPDNLDCVFTTTQEFNITNEDSIHNFLNEVKPSVILNLSGQNNVDIVESDPDKFFFINEKAPEIMADWSNLNNGFMIQASTQGVFSGNNPRYKSSDIPHPITQYGKQKRNAEISVSSILDNFAVTRLTFVYGIRPNQQIGRGNPLEAMMSNQNQLQVDDRFFSPLWSKDAASILWDFVLNKDTGFFHLGESIRVSRYMLACHCAWDTARILNIRNVSHNFFEGIAERPIDTTWDKDSLYKTKLEEAILTSYMEWRNK